MIFRGGRPRVLCKKGVLRNFANSQGGACARGSGILGAPAFLAWRLRWLLPGLRGGWCGGVKGDAGLAFQKAGKFEGTLDYRVSALLEDLICPKLSVL